MQRLGWVLGRASTVGGASLLFYNKPGLSCEIAIGADRGKTIVFANLVDK